MRYFKRMYKHYLRDIYSWDDNTLMKMAREHPMSWTSTVYSNLEILKRYHYIVEITEDELLSLLTMKELVN